MSCSGLTMEHPWQVVKLEQTSNCSIVAVWDTKGEPLYLVLSLVTEAENFWVVAWVILKMFKIQRSPGGTCSDKKQTSLSGVKLHAFDGEKIVPAIRIKPKTKRNNFLIPLLLWLMCWPYCQCLNFKYIHSMNGCQLYEFYYSSDVCLDWLSLLGCHLCHRYNFRRLCVYANH